jgi:hypothetical protein
LTTWTLPAAQFDLVAAASLNHTKTNPIAWVALTAANTNLAVPPFIYQSGTNMKALIATADLPSTNAIFFALRKIVATQLQVLMPGETNAPGTVTGKTGTPQPQEVGALFNITVNAVDANWNIADYCSDTIQISSTDAQAILGANAALVNGTGAFEVTFETSGSQTVTATDTTQASVLAGSGSSTTVTP